MTVETTDRKQQYTLNGVLADFDFTFRALTTAPSDIKCKVTASGVDTDLTYSSDYTVDVADDGVGGTVTLLDPSGVGSGTLTVYRETTNKQESDYDDYNQFPANTLETDLDRRTLISQENAEDTERTLKLPITASSSVDTELPSPTADSFIGWDSAGTALENKTAADLGAVVKASTADSQGATDDAKYMTPAQVKTEVEYGGAVLIPARNGGTGIVNNSNSTITINGAYSLALTLSGNTSLTLPTSGTIGIGDMSYANTRFKIGQITRAMDGATADVAYTGIGFSPKIVMFFASAPAANEVSFGFGHASTHLCILNNGAVSAGVWTDNNTEITLVEGSGKSQTGIIKTLDADGFTLTWTRTGATAAGTAYIQYFAFR